MMVRTLVPGDRYAFSMNLTFIVREATLTVMFSASMLKGVALGRLGITLDGSIGFGLFVDCGDSFVVSGVIFDHAVVLKENAVSMSTFSGTLQLSTT